MTAESKCASPKMEPNPFSLMPYSSGSIQDHAITVSQRSTYANKHMEGGCLSNLVSDTVLLHSRRRIRESGQGWTSYILHEGHGSQWLWNADAAFVRSSAFRLGSRTNVASSPFMSRPPVSTLVSFLLSIRHAVDNPIRL